MDEQHLCPTCKFYRTKLKNTCGSEFVGYCHRYPRVYSNGHYNIIEVKDVDWCGEWVASEEYIQLHTGES